MKLFLYKSEQNFGGTTPGGECLVYRLSSGSVHCDSSKFIDDPKRLLRLGLKWKEKYATFIYELNQDFQNAGFHVIDEISPFFLTDLSCKRSEFFPTFHDFCHIKLIEELVGEHQITEIIYHGVGQEFIWAAKTSSVLRECKATEFSITESALNYDFLKYFKSQLFFFSCTAFQILVAKIFIKKSGHSNAEYFFTRFPLHLNKYLEEDKFGELSRGKKYLVSIFSDGMHQRVKPVKYFSYIKFLKNHSNQIAILDRWVNFTDVIKHFAFSFILFGLARKVFKRRLILGEIDLTDYIKLEARYSMLRLPRLLMHKKAFEKFFQKNRPQKLTYYLHEYPWGRLISHLCRVNDVKSVGFQHGPSGILRMNYILAKDESFKKGKDSSKHVPIPDEVLAENEFSREVYEDSGYENVTVMPEIYRLSYLKQIKRSESPNGILIVCGLHDGYFLFTCLLDEIQQRPDKKFLLRLHPRANNKLILDLVKEKNLPNMEIAEGNIALWLSTVDEVVYTYSSVADEAKELGIKRKHIWARDRIYEHWDGREQI